MVVVLRFADDVGMVAGRAVDPLDDPELEEQLDRSEHRRPADTGSPRLGVGHEIGGREVTLSGIDEFCDSAARFGESVAAGIECSEDRFWHGRMILSLIWPCQRLPSAHGAMGRNGPPGRAACPSLRERPTGHRDGRLAQWAYHRQQIEGVPSWTSSRPTLRQPGSASAISGSPSVGLSASAYDSDPRPRCGARRQCS